MTEGAANGTTRKNKERKKKKTGCVDGPKGKIKIIKAKTPTGRQQQEMKDSSQKKK